jgi:hypothetical protein
MPHARSSRVSPGRILWSLGGVGFVLLLAWAGPAVWWVATECQANCTPSPGSGQLRLSSGATLPLLWKGAQDGAVSVDYVTQVLQDETRLCSEVREVFRALRANGGLAEARKVLVSPNDPHTRMLGITWHGPVFTCCVSTGVIFRRSEDGDWKVSSGPCRE